MREDLKNLVMDLLVNEGVFLIAGGPFKTSGGLDVPFYIDFRKICYNPDAMKRVTAALVQRLRKKEFDVIAGIETTGIPFATYLSLELQKPLVWLRKTLREHGRKTTIAGRLPKKEARILVVDDSVGGGDSTKAIRENLEKEGYSKISFLYIMEGDIMGRGGERINSEDYMFLSTWKEWVDYLLAKNRISEKLANYCREFIENPLSFDKTKLSKYKKDLENGKIWIK